MDDEVSVGAWLRQRRDMLHLTREDVARRLNCAVSTVRKWETDERHPLAELATKLAVVLDIPADSHGTFVKVARGEWALDRLVMASSGMVATVPRLLPPTNLPMLRSRLIGRTEELAQLAALLQCSDIGMVTLTGPGGVGKTRLGIQVAAEARDAFPGGVYFVDLAPLRDAGLVIRAIAQTLGIRDHGRLPLLEILANELHHRTILVLLDNFEHLLDAAPQVAALLTATTMLTIMVTSRERLRLRGEQEFAVQPLALPDTTVLPAIDQLTQCASIALFLQCACASRLDFTLTDANAPTVAALCRRLDGLPLAIELAAAQVKMLAPTVLLMRLSSRLTPLANGPRDLPARQQTLRQTIGWSYHLLSDDERALFRQLAVFVGGCTLEAVEAIAHVPRRAGGASGGPPDPAASLAQRSTLDLLAALLDKSLLKQSEAPDTMARWVMLETIREYALEQLDTSAETEQFRERHARYYLALVEQSEAALHGVEQLRFLDLLEAEHDNLRSALRWSTSSGAYVIGARLAAGLSGFWDRRGYWSEGQRWLEVARTQSSETPMGLRAKVLLGLARVQFHPAAAQPLLQASLALYREVQDLHGTALALYELGWASETAQGQATHFEESLACFQALGDRWGIAATLDGLGSLALERADTVQATSLLMASLSLQQEIGDMEGIAWSLSKLAEASGAYDAARADALFSQSIALFKALHDTHGIALTTHRAAEAALRQQNKAGAASLFAESLAYYGELGDGPAIQHVRERLDGLTRDPGSSTST